MIPPAAVARQFVIRWRWYIIAATVTSLLLLGLSQSQNRYIPHFTTNSSPHGTGNSSVIDTSARNATLGFQAILALSVKPSWRTRGLQAAADLTGLQIQIPKQAPAHPDIINVFAAFGPPEIRHPDIGSVKAWLAHLDLIKYMVQSDLESALILEDDVDWDVAIREQMVGIADAVRNFTNTPAEETAPYGHDWDVLWLGWCGNDWKPERESVFVDDPTVCPRDKYTGWARESYLAVPEGKRAVYREGNPICSFAYAVSRNGAKNVLQAMGAGGEQAFDIGMLNACRGKGPSGNLNCIHVMPELMHHYVPALEGSSVVNSENGRVEAHEDAEYDRVMGSTEDILNSARCKALWGSQCTK